MFKVGDVIEGIEDNRWVVGTIVCVRAYDGSYGLDVLQTKEYQGCELSLHDLGDKISDNRGWFVSPNNAKLAKNYVVKQIIEDLL